jgi:hypothetical protein
MNEIRTGQKHGKAVRRFRKMPFLPQLFLLSIKIKKKE